MKEGTKELLHSEIINVFQNLIFNMGPRSHVKSLMLVILNYAVLHFLLNFLCVCVCVCVCARGCVCMHVYLYSILCKCI